MASGVSAYGEKALRCYIAKLAFYCRTTIRRRYLSSSSFAPSLLAIVVVVPAVACTTITKEGLRRSSQPTEAAHPASLAIKSDYSFLVLDLNENGRPDLVSAHASRRVRFDMTASGQLHEVAWVQASDGILAFDFNGNGAIESASEIFGPYLAMTAKDRASGRQHKDGFAALQMFDVNRDGRIDKHDPLFAKLLIWQDHNGNAVSEPRELTSLNDHGITALVVSPSPVKTNDPRYRLAGNEVRLTSDCETSTGGIRGIYSVWLASSPPKEATSL